MVSSPRTNPSSAHGSRTNPGYQSSARDLEHHRSTARSAPTSGAATTAVIGKTRHIPLENDEEENWKRHGGKRTKKSHVPEDPRLARQAAAAAVAASTSAGPSSAAHSGNGDSAPAAKKRVKGHEKVSVPLFWRFATYSCHWFVVCCSFAPGSRSRVRSGESGCLLPNRRTHPAVNRRVSRFLRLRPPLE